MTTTNTPPPTFDNLHPEVAAALIAEGIPPAQVFRRYSDAQIVTADIAQASRLRAAGAWRSMATLTRNQGADAAAFPWLVEIPFAYLAALIAEKRNARNN